MGQDPKGKGSGMMAKEEIVTARKAGGKGPVQDREIAIGMGLEIGAAKRAVV